MKPTDIDTPEDSAKRAPEVLDTATCSARRRRIEELLKNAVDLETIGNCYNLEMAGRLRKEAKELRKENELERLNRGLQDIYDRVSGKRGNTKWVLGHLENLLAGREYNEWE